MTKLNDYTKFKGFHWETGAICNHLAYRGFTAPHTQEPYTEAMLMGVSGGAVMGYFSFAYQGYDPQVAILTRNTFDPLETILERLGVEQTLLQTGSPAKGLTNLTNALTEGLPPIVWADIFSLPYNALPYDEKMWQMFPLVVYGYEPEAETVWIADRANVPLTVTPETLTQARARVKKLKFRLLTLDMPNPDKFAGAIQKGIWDCIKLYTEAPPRGSKSNFGLTALNRWADLLVKPKKRLSWAKEFPPGRKMYAGLTSTFNRIALFGQDAQALDAERGLYANFLDEAAVVLAKPALKEAAGQFRRSALAWRDLAEALLPDEVPLFQETRELMLRKQRAFLERGQAALAEMQQINNRLEQLGQAGETDFPLTDQEAGAMRANLRDHVLKIHDLEQEAVSRLQEAMR